MMSPAGLGFLMMMALPPGEAGGTPEALFFRAIRATGREYREARDALLAAGPEAVALLAREATAAGGTEEGRWLAAILLDRARHADEFARLEEVFAGKVWMAEYGGPRITASQRPPKALISPPTAPPAPRPANGPGRPFAGEFARWYEAVRLPESDLWGPLLGEVLLKGWTARDFPPPPPPGSDLGQRGEGERLDPEDYLRQAVHVLGLLGERRAGGPILRILQDPKPDRRPGIDRRGILGLRPLAVEALGRLRYGPALDTLLDLAERRETSYEMVAVVFPAIRRYGSPRAIPVLERIARRPFVPNASEPNWNAINRGTTEAMQTLRILRGEEAAPPD